VKHPRRWLAGVGAAVVIAGGAGATIACTCDTPNFSGETPHYFTCYGPDPDGCWDPDTCTTTISSDLDTAITDATAGDVICLTAAGSPYPELELTSIEKDSETVIQPEPGAEGDVEIAGIDIRDTTHLTFQGIVFSPPYAQYMTFTGNQHLHLFHDTFENGPVQFCTGTLGCGFGFGLTTTDNVVSYAKFLHITNEFEDGGLIFKGDPDIDLPSGFTVTHSFFTLRNPGGQDGCSDGIQLFSNVYNVDISFNEMTGMEQTRVSDGVNCSVGTPNSVHVDPIQPFGGWHTTIDHNWIHGQSNAGDYGCHDECHFDSLTENVFVSMCCGRGISAAAGGDVTDIAEGLVINHNMVWSNISIGNTGDGSVDNTVTNNVARNGFAPGEKVGVTEDYNMCLTTNQCVGAHDVDSNSPVFVGGSSPTTYCGWQLDAASPGYHAGEGGESMGISGDIC
jgi:hypothetical protein